MQKELIVLETPTIERCNPSNFFTENQMVQSIVDSFILELEQNISKDSLNIFYTNLKTLEIKIEDNIKEYIKLMFSKKYITGSYDSRNNTLYATIPRDFNIINRNIMPEEERLAVMYHELLHMSATILERYKDTKFSGFCQVKDNQIGIAINEGYIELLLHRLFYIRMKYITYKYELHIARNVERIVGHLRMTDLYFNADLYNLVGDLERYSNINRVEKFIDDFDTLYRLQGEDKYFEEDIIHYHNDIIKFLIDTYQEKLDINLRNKIITHSECNRRFDDYLIRLDKASRTIGIEDGVKALIRLR